MGRAPTASRRPENCREGVVSRGHARTQLDPDRHACRIGRPRGVLAIPQRCAQFPQPSRDYLKDCRGFSLSAVPGRARPLRIGHGNQWDGVARRWLGEENFPQLFARSREFAAGLPRPGNRRTRVR